MELNIEFKERKLKIVRFLLSLILIPFLFALFWRIVQDTSDLMNDEFESSEIVLLSFLFSVTGLFLYARIKVNINNFRRYFGLVLFFVTLAALMGLLSAGNGTPLPYLIFIAMVIASSIVFSIKAALIYTLFIACLSIFVIFVHTQEIISYTPELSTTRASGAIVTYLFIMISYYIAYVGYNQIEHYYQKAASYLSELEALNKSLEDKVKLRTKRLEKTFEIQADSVYKAAVIGSITQPMIHDLTTPLSALNGSIYLMEDETISDKEREEVLKHSKVSIQQLERIINSTRDLMQGSITHEEFHPFKEVQKVLFVIKDNLHKNRIKVDWNINEDTTIFGPTSMFGRIITNVIQNAIEELTVANKDTKLLTITGTSDETTFSLTVTDSGRGIKSEFIDQLFEPAFSLKGDTNLGFGLPFVKKHIEKYFNGSVTVSSKEGKYTTFTLMFSRKNSAQRITDLT